MYIQCISSDAICVVSGSVIATPDGKLYSTGDNLIFMFLILFFASLPLVVYMSTKDIDFDSWHKKISDKYDGKNDVKIILSSMAMIFIKDAFLIYYLLGWPILILVREMITRFNITYVAGIFDAMGIIYTAGLLIVIMLFWGRLQEFIMEIFDEKNLKEWGI